MIGPTIPGPSTAGPSIGPQIPASKPLAPDSDDEDDYVPELPPHLAAQRSTQTQKRVVGPTLPSLRPQAYDDDEDEDDVGPMPLPSYLNSQPEEQDGVTEFLEREKRRKKAIEDAAKPKALKRDEWMLVPPSASDLLGSIDPTRLNKGRKFAPSTTPNARNPDTSLWTETPAERQQRLSDELSGKRKRKENSDGAAGEDDGKVELEERKRRKRDEEIQKAVSEHTRKNRPDTLLNMHSKAQTAAEAEAERKKEEEGIWDHSRDMALGGKLLDDRTRNKFITEARGLGDRFGSSKFA